MKKTILVVDDSKAIRFLLQTVLGKDYQVVTAPDACTAMYWLSKNNLPDVIVCDPRLPDVRDWELIEEISSSILYGNIPVMVVSSLDKDITELKCHEYGIAEYFMKPFNPISLLESISELTEKRVPGQVM